MQRVGPDVGDSAANVANVVRVAVTLVRIEALPMRKVWNDLEEGSAAALGAFFQGCLVQARQIQKMRVWQIGLIFQADVHFKDTHTTLRENEELLRN